MMHSRRGVVLIEVICAMAVIATTALAALAVLRQVDASITQASERHRRSVVASDLLSRAVLGLPPSVHRGTLRGAHGVEGLVVTEITLGETTLLRVTDRLTREILLETHVLAASDREER